ncbi:uncharacterized protein [Paralichthys olivaceus]|uniref:uncharacterized protein n=1 Tax=Paralichthys olivaceus TaxID=8255 RepID=UPI003752F9CB
MSAVCLKLVTLLCLSCLTLSDPEKIVVSRKPGEAITIHCRSPDNTDEYLDLCRDLCQGDKVVYMNSENVEIVPAYKDRAQITGAFSKVDIFIKNLTLEDTGQYWCMYKKVNEKIGKVDAKCRGSVLLVVKEEGGVSGNGNQACETKHQGMLLVTVVTSAVVLLCFIVGACMWLILKTKTFPTTKKPRRVINNEVYEDMRATIRR